MTDAMTPNEAKRLIILYRATVEYTHSTIQSTIRFLHPRVSYVAALAIELQSASHWWKYDLDEEQRRKLLIQYKFATKEF